MEKQRSDHLNQTFDVTNLESLIKGYILNCQCEGKSPSTLSFYQNNLKRFLWYCHRYNLAADPAHVTTHEIRQFLWYVASEPVRWGGPCPVACRPVGQTTVAHYYHCLHIFFEWLKAEGLVTQNPLAHIRRPKKHKKIIQALSAREIKTLLEQCSSKTVLGCRARAIVMMLIDGGMRVSELAGLRLPNIDIDTGSILIRNGKGGKQRVVRIGATAQKALWRYLALFRRGQSDRVFLSNTSEPMGANAMKLNDSGDALRLLQEHLGHASFNTTAKYRKVAGEEHRKWYESLWGENT